MGYRVRAMNAEVADAVRRNGVSWQYRHAAETTVATGYGPCRVCLDRFQQGVERRILFTYNPFLGEGEWPQPGPVFVHERACEAFSGDAVPEWLRQTVPLFVEGFAERARVVKRVEVIAGDVAGAVAELWSDTNIDYAHLRNGEAGCFIARLERV